MKASYKLDEWIKEYQCAGGGNNFIVPNYKIERLYSIEKENIFLRNTMEVLAENLKAGTDKEIILEQIRTVLRE